MGSYQVDSLAINSGEWNNYFDEVNPTTHVPPNYDICNPNPPPRYPAVLPYRNYHTPKNQQQMYHPTMTSGGYQKPFQTDTQTPNSPDKTNYTILLVLNAILNMFLFIIFCIMMGFLIGIGVRLGMRSNKNRILVETPQTT